MLFSVDWINRRVGRVGLSYVQKFVDLKSPRQPFYSSRCGPAKPRKFKGSRLVCCYQLCCCRFVPPSLCPTLSKFLDILALPANSRVDDRARHRKRPQFIVSGVKNS